MLSVHMLTEAADAKSLTLKPPFEMAHYNASTAMARSRRSGIFPRTFRLLSLVALTCCGPLLGRAAGEDELVNLPDPLVGTDSSFALSHGNTYPGVFLPHAMATWSPQTGEGGWMYQYKKDSLIGFRYTHRPSAWMDDWGSFSIMPVAGHLEVTPEKRASHFRHEDEMARAYSYQVMLKDSGVRVEMAPSEHCGILQFTYRAGAHNYVVFDGGDGGSSVQIDRSKNTISGRIFKTRKGTASNFAVYFVLEFSKPFSDSGTWDISGLTDGKRSRDGKHVGAYVEFPSNVGAVSVRVGSSLISLQQAIENLNSEIPNSDYAAVAKAAKRVWEHELRKVELTGGTEAERRTFYTALYHTLQFPRLLNEKDSGGHTIHYGLYDGKVHPGPMFTDDGFWDTYRAAFPLLTLLDPKKDAEIIRAIVNTYEEAGWIPKWPNPVESNVMIATHGDSAVADAYEKGIRDFDVEKAYAAIRKDATEPGSGIFAARVGFEDQSRLGYVPADKYGESVSRTLGDAYDDFCVSQMARSLGHADDARTFLAHSKNYRNVFDPSVGFMRGRNSDRTWTAPFDPIAWGGPYTEGDAWQWLWSVQQDVGGLIGLLGGRESFTRKLDTFFSTTSDFKVGGYKSVIHEMTEAKLENMGQYAHVNEPVHHVIYLYDYIGQPWKAQKLIREVEAKLYQPGPGGWLGDEDTGQMSAWYIFSSLGFYPVTPGIPVYAIGTPSFTRAAIHLDGGKTLTIEAERHSAEDIYVQSVTFNGRALTEPWVTHAQLMGGGTLQFRLGAQPNREWGASAKIPSGKE